MFYPLYAIRYTLYEVLHAIRCTQYAIQATSDEFAFTTVENALQIDPFMQNKPNFPDDQMNVNKVLTKTYENNPCSGLLENKPNSNPNKANFRKAKMNINKVLTKDYENEPLFRRGKNKPNSNPIKPNFKHYLAKMGHHELKYVDRLG